MAPMPDDHIARLAQIEATRHLTQTIERMERTVNGLAGEVSNLNTKVAVMQQQDEKVAELKESVARHDAQIQALQLVNAERKGAGGGLKLAREWVPLLLFFVVAIVLLTKSGALHL
jgi:hypothetical protein